MILNNRAFSTFPLFIGVVTGIYCIGAFRTKKVISSTFGAIYSVPYALFFNNRCFSTYPIFFVFFNLKAKLG